MVFGAASLLDSYGNDVTSEGSNLIEDSERASPELRVLFDVSDRVESRAFLLPFGGMFTRSSDLEVQEVFLEVGKRLRTDTLFNGS